MRAIIQRTTGAKLSVKNEIISEIDKGLVVYLGICEKDTTMNADLLAKKIADLRIFRDHNEKINLSVKDISGQVLIVSNFTIYGDCSRGNRPNFMYAMKSDEANLLYEYFIQKLKEQQLQVKTGVFGERMKIEQVNDGPVNIFIEI